MSDDLLASLVLACDKILDDDDPQSAVSGAENITKLAPDKHLSWYSASASYFKSGQYEKAAECAKRAIDALKG